MGWGKCTYVDGEAEELEGEDERRLGLEARLQRKPITELRGAEQLPIYGNA